MAISYYQLLFPNPVYAKVGFGPEVALRGLPLCGHLRAHICDTASFAAGGWLRGLAGSTEAGSACLLTLSLAFPAYAMVGGGDWMPMGRFLIPGLAFGGS